jgi:hypothetical protein
MEDSPFQSEIDVGEARIQREEHHEERKQLSHRLI